MPSYIELNKNASVPASSDPNKVILSVDTSGQVTTTDSTGQTSPVGGGTGLYIPQPIPYRTYAGAQAHIYDEPLSTFGDGSGRPGALQNSWNIDNLKLTYNTSDYTFLNHNPRYFLFVYQGTKKFGRQSVGHPNTRINNQKFGKYFSHPASFTGSFPSFTSTAAYSNFSGTGNISSYATSSFTDYTTEWTVATGSGHPTQLAGFNPLRFYGYRPSGSSGWIVSAEFFPLKITGSFDGNSDDVSVTTKKAWKEYKIPQTTPVQTYTKNRVNLYIKFAIVIDDPNNAGRYLIGPMSDTIRIFPREGYFDDDINASGTSKYYYAWNWKLV